MKKILLKINIDNLKVGLKKGDIVSIEAYSDGTPVEIFWQNRLKDSAIDNCVTVVTEEKTKKANKEANNI